MGIFHRKQRKQQYWEINLKMGEFADFDITDHGIEDSLQIYQQVLDELSRKCTKILFNQVCFRYQHTRASMMNTVRCLSDQYSLDFNVTKRPSLEEYARQDKDSYTVQIYGKPDIRWIGELLYFGQMSSPNVMYFLTTPINKWQGLNKRKNQLWQKWFRLIVGDESLHVIMETVKYMCFGCDAHLCVVMRPGMIPGFLRIISGIAHQYEVTPHIIELN
jgi:hypothetical protein